MFDEKDENTDIASTTRSPEASEIRVRASTNFNPLTQMG